MSSTKNPPKTRGTEALDSLTLKRTAKTPENCWFGRVLVIKYFPFGALKAQFSGVFTLSFRALGTLKTTSRFTFCRILWTLMTSPSRPSFFWRIFYLNRQFSDHVFLTFKNQMESSQPGKTVHKSPAAVAHVPQVVPGWNHINHRSRTVQWSNFDQLQILSQGFHAVFPHP